MRPDAVSFRFVPPGSEAPVPSTKREARVVTASHRTVARLVLMPREGREVESSGTVKRNTTHPERARERGRAGRGGGVLASHPPQPSPPPPLTPPPARRQERGEAERVVRPPAGPASGATAPRAPVPLQPASCRVAACRLVPPPAASRTAWTSRTCTRPVDLVDEHLGVRDAAQGGVSDSAA